MSSWGHNATNQHCKRNITEIEAMNFPACQSWTDWGIILQSLKKESGKLEQIRTKFRYNIVDTKAHDLPRKIYISHYNYFQFLGDLFLAFLSFESGFYILPFPRNKLAKKTRNWKTQRGSAEKRRDSDWIILTARHFTASWVLHTLSSGRSCLAFLESPLSLPSERLSHSW